MTTVYSANLVKTLRVACGTYCSALRRCSVKATPENYLSQMEIHNVESETVDSLKISAGQQ